MGMVLTGNAWGANLSTPPALLPAPISTFTATSAGGFGSSLVNLRMLTETGPALGGEPNQRLGAPLSSIQSIVVSFPIQEPAALQSFVESVSNPFSPNYANFLSTQQFATEYAPPSTDRSLVIDYFQSEGLHVLQVAPNGLSVTVQGSLGNFQKALHVTFEMYSQSGTLFWAPTSSPSVPSGVAPWIYGIAGLTDHLSSVRVQFAGSSQAVAGSGVQDYPDQMHYEFQLNQLYNATGDKAAGVVPTFAKGVTIVQALWSDSAKACGYSVSDIGNFFNNSTGYPTGLPKPVMQPHYSIPGYAGGPPASGNCSTQGLNVSNTATQEVNSPTIELTLDQEYSGIDAPGANLDPTWVNGTGPAATNGELAALVNWVTGGNIPGLDVATQSFGGGESANTNGSFESILEQDYQAAAATGVTVLASSGDSNGAEGPQGDGAAVCGSGPTDQGVPGIDFPGSSPDVLSVGGTANAGQDNSILSGQSVWNWCPSTDGGVSAGSTGGVSLAFPEAWYQQNLSIVNKAMDNAIAITLSGNGSVSSPLGINDGLVYSNTSARPDPDVAGPAANNTIYFARQWLSGYGGTSFSSPAVAGMLGEIIAFDGHPLGAFAPTLYTLEAKWLAGKLALAPTYFVQNYSNAFFNGAFDYNTSAGWGVPLAYNIALDLGKPFITSTPHPSSGAGPYNVSAFVTDHRTVGTVKVDYLEPGAKRWATAKLTLSHGTPKRGTWTGQVPSPKRNGTLEFCVYAVDSGKGNSWTPYNLSAWAATGGTNTTSACTSPYSVAVTAPTTVPSGASGSTNLPVYPGTTLAGPSAGLPTTHALRSSTAQSSPAVARWIFPTRVSR
jgi:subtilase family serine protease